MEDFKDSVKRGFQSCKSDIDTLKEENNSLKTKFQELLEENNLLKTNFNNVNKDNIEIKAELKGINLALEYIKEFNKNRKITTTNSIAQDNNLINNNSIINTAVNNLDLENQNQERLAEIQILNNENIIENKKIKEIKIQKKTYNQRSEKELKDPYEALLAFKAKANKREMLKQKMVSMVSESGMNLSELKFMFVEHFRYCSKATFYNYLKELEIEKILRIEREHSKNHIYINGINKNIF